MSKPPDPPTLEELESTVARMAARLAAHPDPIVATLMVAYGRLCSRFKIDLAASRRDIALAKSAALMLVQEIDHSRTNARVSRV